MSSRRAARKSGVSSRGEPTIEFRADKLRLAGVGVVSAFVALVPLVFDPAADWPFTVPKALLTHALAYLLGGVLIGLIWQYGKFAVPWSWLHVPVLTFLLANVLATIFAVDPYIALFGTHTRMLGLATITSWTVLYFAVVTVVRTHRDVQVIAAAIVGSVSLMLLYEGLQLIHADPFAWNLDTAVRPQSTNGQATTLGSYFTVLGVGSVALAVLAAKFRRRYRVASVVLAVVLLLGAFATGTRSSLIGLAIGAVVLVGILWMGSVTNSGRRITLIAAGMIAMAAIAVVLITPVGARLFQASVVAGNSEEASLARLDTASLDVRGVLYRVALDAVRERPLLGYGPDNFVVAMTRNRPENGPNEARLAYATSAHGWIGQNAVGSGALGLVAYLAIVAAAVALILRSKFTVMGSVAVVMLLTFLGAGLTTVSDVGSDWIFWFATAVVALATSPRFTLADDDVNTAAKGRRGRRARSWSRREAASFIFGAALLLSLIGPMQASRAARASAETRLIGQSAAAIRSGLEATSHDAGRAEYWHNLGLAYVSSQRWPDAAFAFNKAVTAAPWDARNISDLIQVELVLAQGGDAAARAAAISLSADVVRADPNFPDAQVARATVMQFTGNNAEALQAIERAMMLLPESTNERWYVMAAQLYSALGRSADAINVANRAIVRLGPSVALRIELARALLAGGQPRDALVQVDAILSADPGNVVAKQLRSEIESAIAR